LKDPDVDIYNDTCFIVFTSGTTALPKACLHTGASISALAYNSIRFENLDKDRVSLAQLPAYHIWSITNLIILWSVGGKALLPAPVFNPVASFKAITEGKCTDVRLVPAMLMAMTSLPNFRPESIKGLKSVAFGGTLIRPSFTLAARKDLSVDHTVAFYGMSEAIGIAGFVWGNSVSVSEDSCSIGKCAQGMSVKICSANSKNPLERNLSGKLHVSGPSVMKGYLSGEIGDFYKAEDGRRWFKTGDLARMDDNGALFILGRSRDVIIRGGVNISPATIETSLESFRDITVSSIYVDLRQRY